MSSKPGIEESIYTACNTMGALLDESSRQYMFYRTNRASILRVTCTLLRDKNRSGMPISSIIDESARIVNEIAIRANDDIVLQPDDPEYGRTART